MDALKNSTAQMNSSYIDFELELKRLCHDLWSPLAVFNILLENIQPTIPEQAFRQLKSSVDRIRSLVNKATEDTVESAYFPYVSLSNIVNNIICEKHIEWLESPCNFREIEKDIMVRGNKVETERMLSNLLNNAYESLDRKREIMVSLFFSNDAVVLSIRDTGCGIPSDVDYDEIMGGKSLKKNGRGIGLSSAAQYMRSIGGKLAIQSVKDTGTEIRLYFPNK
ncbi:MAG: hypothetical protein A3E84_05265 [Gammaproteobacteria bacterium RIFCSPHIGHO2_12_FULL_42_13]|nr:MAG: hypothetical protein A3E84_05265 [Gammaproteobacteria bacterium RIFCSPHIGHO2_12_FULL_42_13]